jgi:hypothetical protein
MGNLLAAAAKGIAIGHERDMTQKYDLEKYDHQAAHATTLEELRNKNVLANTEQQDTYATDRATVLSEHQISRQEMDWEWKDTDREDAQSHALELQLGNAYLQQQKSTGTVKSHGWSLNTEMLDVFDPENPLAPPTQKPVTIMHSENLGAFSSVGDKLYRTGDPTQPRRQLTPEEQRTEEARLMENLGDHRAEQAFYDDYGYLPMMYAIRLRQSSDSGMREFIDKNMQRETSGPGGTAGGPKGGTESEQIRDRKEWGPQGQAGVKSKLGGMSDEEWESKFRSAAETAGNSPEKIEQMISDALDLGFGPGGTREGAGMLSEAAVTPAAEAAPEAAPEVTPEAAPEVTPEAAPVEGELSNQQAQDIADAIVAIKEGREPGATAAQRIGRGVKSFFTGGWMAELGVYMSGTEQEKYEALPDAAAKQKFVAELKGK